MVLLTKLNYVKLFPQADKTEVQTVLDADKMLQDEKFKYKCEVCGRRYMQEYSYQRHMQCHSGNSLTASLGPHINQNTNKKEKKCNVFQNFILINSFPYHLD